MYRVFTELCRIEKINQQDIADWLNKSLTYVNSRMNQKQAFTIEDIYVICERMNIPYEQIPYYFPKNGQLDFSKRYKKELEEKSTGVNPLSFADVLLSVGKAMKSMEKNNSNNIVSLMDYK